MGHLQVVIFTLGVAIQCAGLFYVSDVWVVERDLVTILVSTMSLLTYISIVMGVLKFKKKDIKSKSAWKFQPLLDKIELR